VAGQAEFFRALGKRIRDLRKRDGYSQEDMIGFGFSAQHWQQIEAGWSITFSIFSLPTLKRSNALIHVRRYFFPAAKGFHFLGGDFSTQKGPPEFQRFAIIIVTVLF